MHPQSFDCKPIGLRMRICQESKSAKQPRVFPAPMKVPHSQRCCFPMQERACQVLGLLGGDASTRAKRGPGLSWTFSNQGMGS